MPLLYISPSKVLNGWVVGMLAWQTLGEGHTVYNNDHPLSHTREGG